MGLLFHNHTAEVSGSEHSLLCLLASLSQSAARTAKGLTTPWEGATLSLACPADGPLPERARELGVSVLEVMPFTAGFTRHPLGLLSNLALALREAAHLAALIQRTRPTLIHANSVRAGIVACVGRILYLHRAPVMVHVRDCVPHNAIGRGIRLLVHAGAVRIIANSQYVARHFALTPAMLAKTRIVHNGVDLSQFDPNGLDAAHLLALRVALGVPAGAPALAVVGQITPWKGQEEAVRALALVIRRHPAARLLVVGGLKFTQGSARYDNRAYADRLRSLAQELGLEQHVLFAGERSDIPTIMALCDAVLVPSWEEPFGRTVIEGMAMARPVIATTIGGPAEIITHGRNGLLVPPRDTEALAAAILRVLDDPVEARQLGRRARTHAERHFSAEAHATAILGVYAEVLGAPHPVAA